MKRRSILLGLGGVSVAGYMLWPSIGQPPTNENGIVPFTGDVISFSGEEAATHRFELENEGPTIIEFEHTGNGRVFIELIERSTGTISRIMDFEGKATVQTLETLATGRHIIRIRGSPSNWSLGIHNYNVHQKGDQQVSDLPIELAGSHHRATGPVYFDPVTDVRFVFRVENGGGHRVALYDEQGVFVNGVFEFQSDGATTEEFTIRLKGVGYLSIQTRSEWTLNVSQR